MLLLQTRRRAARRPRTVCMYVRMYVFVCTCCKHLHVHVHTHILYVCICEHAYTCMRYTHANTYTHASIHVHTPHTKGTHAECRAYRASRAQNTGQRRPSPIPFDTMHNDAFSRSQTRDGLREERHQHRHTWWEEECAGRLEEG